MGSLEAGIQSKRENVLRSHPSGRTERLAFLQRNRSRLSRFILFKKLDYLQWICTIAVFLFFVVLFQMFLPGLVVDKSEKSSRSVVTLPPDLLYLKEIGGLDFGEGVRFEASKLLEKFQKEANGADFTSGFNRTQRRFGYRKPRIALVFADLLVDPEQLLMVTVASALREIGYAIQVYSLNDGPVHNIWQNIGIPFTMLKQNHSLDGSIDWLNYDGILVNSIESRSAFSSLMQEPFKSLPLIWTIHDESLATISRQYNSTGQIELLNDWKKIFNRASVVVFPSHFLAMSYSMFDSGNFYVIPGFPTEAWRANNLKESEKNDTDVLIAIVGSQFLYRGIWLEHALVLKALLPLFDNNANSHLKIVVLGGDSTRNYSMAVEALALNLTYPNDVVKHVSSDREDEILSIADVVVYGSFREEQSFPQILVKAMSFEKPIIAPDIANIKKYVDDRVNGYLFPKANIHALLQISLGVLMDGKISPLARNIASVGRSTVKNLMVQETVEGFALLVESVLRLSSEVASPKAVKDITQKLREEWQWHLFEAFLNSENENRTAKSYGFLRKLEEEWHQIDGERLKFSVPTDDSFVYEVWEEEKFLQMTNTRKRREEEELKDRTDQSHGTWEEVYKSAKRAVRSKNDLHERDERELERTGQPLCIYEPYFGEGTWPFLHLKSLYRGIGLSTKGRRPGADDIDAPSRLPLLNNLYFRDTLGEYGAFFAISNRIDRVHKNAWIGFQSWRATARKASLSETAEHALLSAIETRKHGDALYFWVRMDEDSRNPSQQDFWSFCNAINAGNCRFAFNETLKRMYGVKHLKALPPMPDDGGTWSVMHSWALPTRSFLEFVMFSRMFVDSLDAQMYEEHHRTARCYLSLTKDKHCYSRLLELLINVWTYHSARHMVYVHPDSGIIQEQHKLKTRRGKMWIKWFQYSTLKAMDEELAEIADSDRPSGHWLWPSSGEIVWQGTIEKEKHRRNEEKERKKQRSRDKLTRMKIRSGRQKAIGKYVKPPPEETGTTNSTAQAA